jgi:glycosyltransferase involved in cell wall biosynthesis
MGPVFGEDKRRAFAAAHVFCLPTAYPTEALPLSILEAMQYGLAVVTTSVGAIGEAIVADAGGVVVQAESVEDIFDALNRLADDRDAVQRMGIANQARFAECFSMDRISQRWLDLVGRFR